MDKKHVIALKAGLSWGLILVLCELAFGVVQYFLRPSIFDFLRFNDPSELLPFLTVEVAFLFLVFAVYFACGMISAKWLAAFPVRSAEIAILGAIAAAVSEIVRSLVSVPINFILSYLMPFPGVMPTDVFNVALGNALVRIAIVSPAFILIAVIIGGISAYVFSKIFFRPEPSAGK